MTQQFKYIGSDVIIHPDAIIKRPEFTTIQNHVAIDNGVTVSTKLQIGNYVHISPYVVVIGGIDAELVLKDFVFVAAGTKVVCGSEDYTGVGLVGATIPKKFRVLNISRVTFENFSGCGVNCSILPGVTLAEGSVLGANSLLTKSTEPWTIYVGSPARPIKTRRKDIILQHAQELGYKP